MSEVVQRGPSDAPCAEMYWRSLKVMVYGASGSSVGPSTSGCNKWGIGRAWDWKQCRNGRGNLICRPWLTDCDLLDEGLDVGRSASDATIASEVGCGLSVDRTLSSIEPSETSKANEQLIEALGFMVRLTFDRPRRLMWSLVDGSLSEGMTASTVEAMAIAKISASTPEWFCNGN